MHRLLEKDAQFEVAVGVLGHVRDLERFTVASPESLALGLEDIVNRNHGLKRGLDLGRDCPLQLLNHLRGLVGGLETDRNLARVVDRAAGTRVKKHGAIACALEHLGVGG